MTVTDTGQGIRPEFLPHLFERFRQADSSTKRAHGGLGVGLAIVRTLVELHGGSVEAASRGEGQGATFTVRLPTIERQPESAADERRRRAVTDHAGLHGPAQNAASIPARGITSERNPSRLSGTMALTNPMTVSRQRLTRPPMERS